MTIVCERCKKKMQDTQFYTYKNGSKTELCKKCLTAHIDNFDESTYVWLLQKMDVPYIPAEWGVLRQKAFDKNPDKMDGMSVFGKYLSKMKLNQWNKYTWADTERLQAEAAEAENQKSEEEAELAEMYKQQLEAGEISEAQYKTLVSTQEQYKEYLATLPPAAMTIGANNMYDESQFIAEEDMVDYGAELTMEDKKFLAMKWGRLYKPSEWVELERSYNEMMASFDIQDADTINTLILLCKTNLKMNQSLDSGDIEGYQKLSKVSESLRKTAKFTAAQNKEDKGDCVDSVGQLVAMCERDGFIPRFATDIPQDKVDATLLDMNNYLKKLVTQDLGFGQQIEDSIKKIQMQKEMNSEEAAAIKIPDVDDDLDTIEDEDMEEYFKQQRDLLERSVKISEGDED